MSEATLKPCPFCGGDKARTIHIRDGRKVACICGACGKPQFNGPLDKPSADERAITAWNTRAEAISAEPVAWMYRRDGRNVILRERLHRDGVLQGVTGWTETPLYTHPPAAPDTVTLDRAMVALLAVVNATRAYLPPDGIDAQECLNRILAATDNPEINPIIAKAEEVLK